MSYDAEIVNFELLADDITLLSSTLPGAWGGGELIKKSKIFSSELVVKKTTDVGRQ